VARSGHLTTIFLLTEIALFHAQMGSSAITREEISQEFGYPIFLVKIGYTNEHIQAT
jgi:hypothetical protein